MLERHVGGRIYERTSDGREIDWCEITAWAPPRRVAYLWHISRDRADATDVVITFADRGNGATRVEIVTPVGLVELEHNPRNNRIRAR